ncbi:MAG: alpha/beta hydrolase-fold protein [Clostridia bacterium]|nr:alpha/beta hydrolase-fold protein [Clostridia bacterium]
MFKEMLTHHSSALDREMHIMVYGRGGTPFLCFPTQNSMCRNYEDFGLIGQLEDYLENGQLQMFVVDTVDAESWSMRGGDNARRAARQEQYYHYIVDEAVPLIRQHNDEALPMVMGLSLGANHASIVFLRRPDLFGGVLALSGVYDTDCFFDGWMNPTLYDNSPERFLPNMPHNHAYIDLYNQRKLIFCVGQGAWEEDGVRTLRNLQRVFDEKGILAWFDFWGSDVNHDWPWWYKQTRYFLPHMLRERQARHNNPD